MAEQVDICIIGGGILGCMAARELSRYEGRIILLEKNADVCCGITKGNSSILYAGYDHKPGSLKSRLCIQGNAQMEQICEELEVPMRRCGSLMIGFGPESEKVLRKKYEQGLLNQVPGLELLSGKEVLALEKYINPEVKMGLLAPSAGTVNPWKLGIAAWENAMENGCECRRNTEVVKIFIHKRGFEVIIRNRVSGEESTIFARGILNCAGIYADKVRGMIGTPTTKILPTKGTYLVFDASLKQKPEHIIFYEPEKKQKGVTIVPASDGCVLAGASEEPALSLTDTGADEAGIFSVQEKLRYVVPEIDFSKVLKNFAVLRPNPVVNGDEMKSIHSFVIDQPQEHPEMVSLIGIKTPGLTCSVKLAEYAVERLFEGMKWHPEKKSDFQPVRKSGNHMMLSEDVIVPSKEKREYNNIICHCQKVTEGEIREAIRKGAVDLEGVRHRCATQMGKCQGTRCREKIRRILMDEEL